MTLRDKIAARSKRKYRCVELDGDSWWLRSLSNAEISKVGLVGCDKKGNPDFNKFHEMQCKQLCLALVASDGGEPEYSLDDWQELSDLEPAIFNALYLASEEMAGVQREEVKSAEEDAVKN